MAERNQRCRYPDCEIHLGLLPDRRRQAEVGPGERADILADYRAGASRTGLADSHRLPYDAIISITRGAEPQRSPLRPKRRRGRPRKIRETEQG